MGLNGGFEPGPWRVLNSGASGMLRPVMASSILQSLSEGCVQGSSRGPRSSRSCTGEGLVASGGGRYSPGDVVKPEATPIIIFLKTVVRCT